MSQGGLFIILSNRAVPLWSIYSHPELWVKEGALKGASGGSHEDVSLQALVGTIKDLRSLQRQKRPVWLMGSVPRFSRLRSGTQSELRCGWVCL